MTIRFYNIEVNEGQQIILVKEKTVNYSVKKLVRPKHFVKMMNQLFQLDSMAEECCYLFALNTECKLLGGFLLSKDTVNYSQLNIGGIFLRAFLVGASYVLLIHNHPSGDATPSKTDIQVTQRIRKAGILLDISLLDHIIVAKDGFYSFYEKEAMGFCPT